MISQDLSLIIIVMIQAQLKPVAPVPAALGVVVYEDGGYVNGQMRVCMQVQADLLIVEQGCSYWRTLLHSTVNVLWYVLT